MTRYITKLFFVSAFLLLGTAADIFASSGNLDLSFNGTGRSVFNIESAEVTGSFTNVVVIGGNKFLVVGQARIADGTYYGITLTRYNSDGTLDTSFGTGGKVITDAGVSLKGVAIALQSDGKIIVAAQDGTFYSGYSTVLRYTSEGALDTTFAGGTGIFFNNVMKLARDISILPDNSILIAGDNTNDPIYTGHTQVTKLTPNGTLDNAFGTNGVVSTTYSSPSQTDKIVVQNDGKIVVSSTSLAAYKWLVDRFNPNGTPDTTFDSDGLREIDLNGLQWAGGLGLQPDGKLVLGGNITVSGNNTQIMLTRLNSNGTTDNGFGSVSPGYVFYDLTPNDDRTFDLALQSDGKILLSGAQNASVQNSNAFVARFDATGAIDTAFGTGGIAPLPTSTNAGAIALQGSNVVAIESASVCCLIYTFRVARLSTSGAILSDVLETFIVGKNDQARDVAMQTDGKIVTAGVSVNGENRGVMSVARTLPNGTLDASFGNGGVATICGGSNCAANAVAVQPDGKIVVAGQISQQIYSYGALFVARLNTDGTPDNTFGTGGRVIIVGPSSNGVNSLNGQDVALQPDGKIVVAGWSDRTAIQGVPDTDMMVTRLNTNGTSDGQWISFIGAQGFPPVTFYDQAYALAIQPDGKIVLAGTHLLRLNSDLSIDSGFSSTPVGFGFSATDVKLQPDGKIVLSGAAGGNFSLTRFNTNASIDTGFGSNGYAVLDFGGNDIANSIFLDPNGDIIAGGSTHGDYKRFALARFKSSGSPDLSFGNGGKVITDFGGDAGILGLARQSDGKNRRGRRCEARPRP